MKYASREKPKLKDIAIIDEETINEIATKVSVAPNGPSSPSLTIDQVKADSQIASAISLKHSNSNDHAPHSDDQSLSGYVQTDDSRLSDARTPLAHTHDNDHAPHSDDQDLSGKVDKITGKGLSTEDYTTAEKTKLSGLNSGFKCGIATKNINDASTIQNIAHGLGRVPKIVRVSAHCAYAAALSMICQGAYDGTNHAGLTLCSAEGTTTALIDNLYSSTAAELGFTAATGTNPFTGANRQTGVITCNETNIIITWTKAGTVASNVVNILWEVT